MNTSNQELKRTGNFREVLAVALPLILSSSCHAMNMFVDRLMLTRFSPAASAASFTGGLTNFTLSCIFFGTVGYTGTFVAQYAGANRIHRIGRTVWQGIFLSLAGGIILATGIWWAPWMFNLFKHDPEVTKQEIIYFQVLAGGAFVFLLTAALTSFWSGRGKTMTVLIISAVITLFNIPLNYIFIFGKCGAPELGACGAALGTVLAESIGVALCFALFLRKRARERYFTLSCRFDRQLLKRMLVYGLPNGAQLALDLIAFNIFSILLGCYGVTVHEASSITFGINNIAFCPIMGMGQTAAILVGQSIGANDIPLAKRSVRNTCFLVLIYSVVMIVLFSGFQDFMLSAFVRPGDTSQIETMRLAKIMLHFLSLYLLFDGTNITYSNVLRGAGDTSFTMWTLAVVGIVFFAIPCLVAFYLKMAWWVLWSLLCFEILLLCIIYTVRYRQGKWTKMRVIEN